MKRITFLAAFIVSLMSFGAAKAQVSAHIGVNIGNPGYYGPTYYEPRRVVVVERAPVYRRYPVRSYYRRPVVVERRYYSPRTVVVRDRYYGHPSRGHGHGRGRW
jgi:hypothetical protein